MNASCMLWPSESPEAAKGRSQVRWSANDPCPSGCCYILLPCVDNEKLRGPPKSSVSSCNLLPRGAPPPRLVRFCSAAEYTTACAWRLLWLNAYHIEVPTDDLRNVPLCTCHHWWWCLLLLEKVIQYPWVRVHVAQINTDLSPRFLAESNDEIKTASPVNRAKSGQIGHFQYYQKWSRFNGNYANKRTQSVVWSMVL